MKKVRTNYHSWYIEEKDFPEEAGSEEQLKFLINYAILAPSGHNTQPWKFSVKNQSVSLYADFSNWLPAVDPEKRELHISLGCALFNLLVAAEYFGFTYKVNYFPREDLKDLIAVMEFRREESEKKEILELFSAIKKRHTNRRMFEKRQIEDKYIERWKSYIKDNKFRIDFLTGEKKDVVGKLTNQGYKIAFANKEFRKELGTWTHHNWTKSKDGMPLFGMNIPLLLSFIGPVALRKFKILGTILGKLNEKQIQSAPVVCVINSKEDTPKAWVRVGEYFGRIVLDAASKNIWSGIMAASIEEGELYKELQQLLNTQLRPQVVFRLGYSKKRPPYSPRKSLEEVLL